MYVLSSNVVYDFEDGVAFGSLQYSRCCRLAVVSASDLVSCLSKTERYRTVSLSK